MWRVDQALSRLGLISDDDLVVATREALWIEVAAAAACPSAEAYDGALAPAGVLWSDNRGLAPVRQVADGGHRRLAIGGGGGTRGLGPHHVHPLRSATVARGGQSFETRTVRSPAQPLDGRAEP